jgi:RPA family protein
MSSSDDGDDGPGRREVAARLLAAEFDDVTVSYRESDEERAPNYVVLPTGARVNRAFAVGVLTEVEQVNDGVVRARVADPTGAFVSYAGQYQPEALAFFERTEPPEFVALTGKARTFEPEDGDRVFSSLRPESVNAVDADTRDRWVVDAARATLRRVAVAADALGREARGDELRAALADEGVSESLAAGVPLALERYGTTEAYLDEVRRMAVEALELVAGERDAVSGLSLAPAAGGAATLGPLPSRPTAATGTPDSRAPAEADVAADAGEAPEATVGSGADGDPTAEAAPEAESTSTTGADPTDEAPAAPTDVGSPADAAPTDEPEATAATDDDPSGPTDDLGDFDTGEFDDDGLYEMDETERAEAAEFGTEFETATEVDSAGEADIDVPEPEASADDDAAGADGAAAATDAEEDGPEHDTAAGADLEDAVVDAMRALDDGSGADRETVVARVVDDHGADPDAVEEAVQDALMSGRCYEPDETTLKPI